jgi:hypothetical protein
MMSIVFAKSTRGQQEIQQRSGELTPRVRRLLILVDGKRSVDELRQVFPADDLTHSLGLLEETGLIEMLTDASLAGPSGTTAQRASLTAFRTLAGGDPANLENLGKARHFMSNTINSFVGTVGTSTLLERIEQTQSHSELRATYDDWYYAIVTSRDGRREAEALRAKLLEVI